METIETERLILRPFAESDYDDLFEFLVQLRDDEYEGYPGITYENSWEHLKYRLNSEEFYAIELKESGKVIGNISCISRDFEAKEVGYIINADFQRKGYAAEALAAVIRHAFRAGAHRDTRNAIPKTSVPGGCWKRWGSNGKPISGRICTSIRTARETPFGKIPMYTLC